MSSITITGISKSFGSYIALRNINATIESGKFVVVLGASGSGKSTLLNIIAGFEKPEQGRILIDDKDILDTPPNKRNLGMVFQKYTLYPNKSVRKNLSFPLEIRPISSPEFSIEKANDPGVSKKTIIDKRVEQMARKLKIDDLLDRKPGQLSGGQMQRVAIGRSLIRNTTRLLLMDEPFSSLDVQLKVQLQYELKQITKEKGLTVFFVTHDQSECLDLADEVLLLDKGTLIQSGTPKEIYDRPANTFVASFFGTPKVNLLSCYTNSTHNEYAFEKTGSCQKSIIAGIRPNHLLFSRPSENSIALPFSFQACRFQGNYYQINGTIGGHPVLATAEQPWDTIIKESGGTAFISTKKILLFDPDTLQNAC